MIHSNKNVKLYSDLASRVAEQSTCKRLKVGAVIVTEEQILAIGYNGTPSGFDNNCEDDDGLTKKEVIHAEMNALAKFATSRESTKGATVFLTHAPCLNCANMLIRAQIAKVYFQEEYRSIDGIKLLEQFGIEVEKIQ